MNLLGIGPMELVLIVVLALIVFGPAKLPELMGQFGRVIGEFRRATSELSDEFNRTIQAELNEAKQTLDETKSALTEVRSAVDSTVTETRSAVAGVNAAQRAATAPVQASGAKDATLAEEATTNGTTAAASPALADTSQWSWETAAPSTPPVAAEEVSDSNQQHEQPEGVRSRQEHVGRDELEPPY
ncbi:MAG: twin-arginine translocase TatA/TatE family subunit [Chloroflexota bacterium]|nr:twin-arginine translocase TatA/TatE family subunit [Chloroflexota bacterium]